MNDPASTREKALRTLLSLRGQELGRQALKGMLADLCPECKCERAALMAAVDNGIAEELGNGSSRTGNPMRIAHLTRRLEDDAGIKPELARWAVEAFIAFVEGPTERKETAEKPIPQTKPKETAEKTAPQTECKEAAEKPAPRREIEPSEKPKGGIDTATPGEYETQRGNCLYFGRGVAKDLAEAVKWWRKAAELGSAAAQNNLASACFNGEGVGQDPALAVGWWRKAAEQDEPCAQSNLADCYFNGTGVEKNLAEAVKWWRKAAELGSATAQNNLASAYFAGKGVERDQTLAVECWRKAAGQGEPCAQCNLADCLFNGLGVAKDEDEAMKWYLKAAGQGHTLAQERLESFKQASIEESDKVKRIRKAAEQGIAWAQNDLALCYENGSGVKKDCVEAVLWYRKAADQGRSDAQRNLARCYEFGIGVKKNPDEAVQWYRRSAKAKPSGK